jgi:hypothetical protein
MPSEREERVLACLAACEGLGTATLAVLPPGWFAEQARANTRLRAANAALLAACRAALAYWSERTLFPREESLYEQLRAAAAKAEGKASPT